MTKRRTAVGLAVLFALALSAFAAASASAKGTTAFTCVTDPNGTLKGDHCLTTGSGEKSKHVAIPHNETTTGTATNENTTEETKAARSAILHGNISGVATEVTCPKVHGEGTFENRTTEPETKGEMYAHAEGKLHYTECVVKKPEGKGCKVANEGTITTEQLTGTTEGQGDAALIKPKVGETFTEIKIEGCSIPALNNTFPVKGAVKAEINGATLLSQGSVTTTEKTLKFGGNPAGLDGALTLKAHSKAGEETNPLSATTVE
ncbi:MAG TPA: hypothetical protein VFJ57_16820 [Solirubrobacterales bacterium]|nr:hypothetical protein [Solirubrobacterales bacterium]